MDSGRTKYRATGALRVALERGAIAAAILCLIAGSAWGGALVWRWGPEGRQGATFVRLTVAGYEIDLHDFILSEDGANLAELEFSLQTCAHWWYPQCGPHSEQGTIVCGTAD